MSSKAKEYRQQYHQVFQVVDATQNDIINSLGNLVEDMMETIEELEEFASKEYQAKRLKQEASARTGIYE